MQKEAENPVRVAYERRNRDLDPQLVWRGKDEQDWSDLVVHAPPLYIQEKVHPKVLHDDLLKQTRERRKEEVGAQPDLFAAFNGIPEGIDKTEFYQHDQNWSNRMILGDSLQVMASLAEREGLRGKVQCIYLDPPYGIKFNSNFQWSTTSRDVKDGNTDHITREPEQVKAFRDTWRDGIHSYLTYLRDRLTVARDLLADSGSIFVQIGDENLHCVRALLDEVFGSENFASVITFSKTTAQASALVANVSDYLVWYTRSIKSALEAPAPWDTIESCRNTRASVSSLQATWGNAFSSHPSHGKPWASICAGAPVPCTSITAPHTRSERRRIVCWVPSCLMSTETLNNGWARFRSSTDQDPPFKCSRPPKTKAKRSGHGFRTAPTRA
jgi:DNA methylase